MVLAKLIHLTDPECKAQLSSLVNSSTSDVVYNNIPQLTNGLNECHLPSIATGGLNKWTGRSFGRLWYPYK